MPILPTFCICEKLDCNSFLQFSHAKFLHTDRKTNELFIVELNYKQSSQASPAV